MSVVQTIRQRIQNASRGFTPSERKLVRLLTGPNPMVAMGSVHQLAERAGVSAPTVVRFGVKLGFGGYADFQRAWLQELESMFSSPQGLLGPAGAVDDFGRELGRMVARAVDDLSSTDAVLELLADERRRVYLRGGWLSQSLAAYLHAQLRQMRSNVDILGFCREQDLDSSMDIGKQDVVVLFDFCPYQHDTVQFASQVAQQGAAIVLFTDHGRSPVAGYARHLLISEVTASAAYDTMVPAMAQAECLARSLLARLGEPAQERMRRFEALRVAIGQEAARPQPDASQSPA